MAVQVSDDYYPEHDERERFVSGEHSSAAIHEELTFLTIGGNPDLELSLERLRDLRDVLVAAVDLAERP